MKLGLDSLYLLLIGFQEDRGHVLSEVFHDLDRC